MAVSAQEFRTSVIDLLPTAKCSDSRVHNL